MKKTFIFKNTEYTKTMYKISTDIKVDTLIENFGTESPSEIIF